ncbi:MAG: 2OG-Fe(II) oxygenase [Alphaproteobacteria bacterium]
MPLPPAHEPAPLFICAASNNPRFNFSTVGGRYVMLTFFGSAAAPGMDRVLADAAAATDVFDDVQASFFGISIDPDDQALERVKQTGGCRFFWDFEQEVSRLYGAVEGEAGEDGAVDFKPVSILIDPMMRVLGNQPIDDPATHMPRMLDFMRRLPRIGQPVPAHPQAPVLVVPRIFEPELCKKLIELYEANGGEESGFMREVDGKTVALIDHGHKRRRDYSIEDRQLIQAIQGRIRRRLTPEIKKAFQFDVTRMERYIVVCYDAEEGGYFRPHRDNTTKGTAHRRFAVTLNLNAEDYEGGQLRFPEFGPQLYKAPTGGAVVFSCSLLHEAMPVTKGKRYVFLPFLYDDAAAEIREQNNAFLGEGVAAYKR